MREDLVSFVRDPGRQDPFYLEMAGISYCDGSYRISRTDSPISVIEYVMEGKGTVVSDGYSFTAKKGDVYLLHQGSTHCYYSDAENPWVKIWINVGGPLVESLLSGYSIQDVVHVPDFSVKDTLDGILADAKTWNGDLDGLFRRSAISLHEIAARIHQAVFSKTEPPASDAARLRSFIERSVYERAGVREFAGLLYLSPSQVIRMFKKEYGVTPYDYLLGKRVETAKLLLRNTGLPVKEIAFRLHFVDEHYFSNYFKKRAGQSPTDYRKG